MDLFSGSLEAGIVQVMKKAQEVRRKTEGIIMWCQDIWMRLRKKDEKTRSEMMAHLRGFCWLPGGL